ncbi:sensor histidine kinase [Nonomuraea rubra]|uniref:sensor histidine kinase n=1 Tax=Nonomuraea rubra TaxID=46180 RepID=UPI00361FE5B2
MRGLPLRIKLIASMLALLGLGMFFIGVVSVSVLHGYLLDRVDSQLHLLSARMDKKVRSDWRKDRDRRAPDPHRVRRDRPGQGARRPVRADADRPRRGQEADARAAALARVRAVHGARHQRGRRVAGAGQRRPQRRTLVVAVSLEEVDAITTRLVLIELLGGGGILLILAVAGVTIVRHSMRPLREIERTAETIAGGELGRRVPDGDPRTEVGGLARSLNGMLAQIEAAFAARSASEAAARRSEDRMRQFVGDASHELRTPLTSIRGFAEYARQNPGADPVELMQRVEKAAGRMSVLVDDLLLLARVDQQRPLKMRPVDMLALAADAVQDARILAPDRLVKLDVVGGAALIVSGDEVRLRQVVTNLVTNAIVHTEPGSPIIVRAGASGDKLFVEVVDHGPGLTPEQVEHVFERFYRADSARSRRRSAEDRGSGLGLAIVQALVRAHDGTVTVDSSPEGGSTFRVELPLALE